MGWSGKLGAALVVGATKGSAGRLPLSEVADELAEAEDEVADAAMLSTVSDRLASAKDRPKAALGCSISWRKARTAKDNGVDGRSPSVRAS